MLSVFVESLSSFTFVLVSNYIVFLDYYKDCFVEPYDFRNVENADGIAESIHKNGIYSLTLNVTEFVKV